jgi:pimeloyl-ACP methyl ester carboxylesterase
MIKPVRVHWKFLLTRLVFALVATWMILIPGISLVHTFFLLHPSCSPSLDQKPGYNSITLQTATDVNLKGWWRPPTNGAAMILLAGSGVNRDAMFPEAEMLTAHGYGVLLMEARNCAGNQVTLGSVEVDDLRVMVAYLQSQPGVEWIGVLGFSVGGVTAICGAARIPEINAVISLGNYPSLMEVLAPPNTPFLSVEWQIQRPAAFFYWLMTGINPADLKPMEDLKTISPRPVFLIYGEKELSLSHGEEQFEAAAEPKQLWIVPGVGHGGYYQSDPAEFERRLIAFLENARQP